MRRRPYGALLESTLAVIGDPMTSRVVTIPLETARLIRGAFLPVNPNKLRGAAPEVVQAAKDFISAVDRAAQETFAGIPGFPPETSEQERSMRRDRYPPRAEPPRCPACGYKVDECSCNKQCDCAAQRPVPATCEICGSSDCTGCLRGLVKETVPTRGDESACAECGHVECRDPHN